MYEEQFEQYVAAVEMASLASEGSGDLNAYDHVAKDLFKDGFDVMHESLEPWKLTVFRAWYAGFVTDKMMERYDPYAPLE